MWRWSWLLQDVYLHLWPLPIRYHQHLHPCDNQKGPQTLPNVPQQVSVPQLRRTLILPHLTFLRLLLFTFPGSCSSSLKYKVLEIRPSIPQILGSFCCTTFFLLLSRWLFSSSPGPDAGDTGGARTLFSQGSHPVLLDEPRDWKEGITLRKWHLCDFSPVHPAGTAACTGRWPLRHIFTGSPLYATALSILPEHQEKAGTEQVEGTRLGGSKAGVPWRPSGSRDQALFRMQNWPSPCTLKTRNHSQRCTHHLLVKPDITGAQSYELT